jgi:RNA ligase (TIGR02306 family)
MAEGLVYVGRIVQIEPISGADRIVLATVDCAMGGIWKGVIPRGSLGEGDLCVAYLPDSVVPEEPQFEFMRPYKFVVKPRRFRGARSECLIIPLPPGFPEAVGCDVTEMAGVVKHETPQPAGTDIIGEFPPYIPRTDEPHFQSVPYMVQALRGEPFYSTVKADGMSTTVYRWRGEFGVCSRTRRVGENSVYWQCARKYRLPENLPEGIALQFELVGPEIRGNRMGLATIEARVFDVWFIEERRYGSWPEIKVLCDRLEIPTVELIEYGNVFTMSDEELVKYAEGVYSGTTNQREGVVIRHTNPLAVCSIGGRRRISFKVINLLS